MPSSTFTLGRAGALAALVLALNLYVQPAAAINLTYYSPEKGVDPAFGHFVYKFYTAAEGNTSTTPDFLAFFDPNATIALGPVQSFTGAEGIKTFKETICSGDCVVNYHFPNVTTVSEESHLNKTFAVKGLGKAHYVNGSCAVSSYETRFTVRKSKIGMADLCPGSGSLVFLDLVGQNATGRSCDDF